MTIPDTFHFVWTGFGFPYHARLAVESVLLAEPDASIVIHTYGDTPRASRHWDRVLLYERVRVSHEDIDELFDSFSARGSEYRRLFDTFGSDAEHAQRNLVPLAVLYRDGGVYLDFDIFLLRSLAPLRGYDTFVGEELAMDTERRIQAARAEVRRLRSLPSVFRLGRSVASAVVPRLAHNIATRTGHTAARFSRQRDPASGLLGTIDRVWAKPELNGAVLGAVVGSPFIAQTLALALEHPSALSASRGSSLLNRSWEYDPSRVHRLSPPAFYSVAPSRSFELFDCAPFTSPTDAYLIRFVSSNHRSLLAKLEETTVTDLRERATFYAIASRVQDSARGLALRDVPFMQR